DGLVIDVVAHEVTCDGKPVVLTHKEYCILHKLAANKDRVFSREQLLDDIWGFDFLGDSRTVDSHVARLRTKLGEWGSKHLRTVYGAGYKIEVN
ncbi:MAG: winged helix-turn-helix transcriptional regulator, partial [Oscillospiraceae bacterium]|nr:winged helix-turn-helix transcriptional regulator [Oscillospiraceae bacterium]